VIRALCEPVPLPKDSAAFRMWFCTPDDADQATTKEREARRVLFYRLAAALLRAYANIANEMLQAGYSADQAEDMRREVEKYERLRSEIKIASGDYIDLKAFEPAMRHLIDTYIRAEDSKKISVFDDKTLLQLIIERGTGGAIAALPAGIAESQQAVAETIENNIRRVIIDESPINPKYYERMSELLHTLIGERKAGAIDYEGYLQRVAELAAQVSAPIHAYYPPVLNTAARRSLYDNLNQNEALALALDTEILHTRKDGWRGNRVKEIEVRRAIRKHIHDDAEVGRVLELVRNQMEY
jgi:type I restriction enzyme, R subunit